MVSRVQHVAIDCADAYALSLFWSAVTGSPTHPEDGPGAEETQVLLAEGPVLHFNQVPESKTIKNRIHLCLRPENSRDEEVDRLRGIGATFVADHRNPDGSGWVILADPEGNEFCVLRNNSGCES
ncbi:VOC family protein [Nocardia sp. GTS18]|uniref:VOC family protein n=1 Tax=Nocardia sp. GTS18 TaxID=1778064 RepID=UPI0015EE7AE1|nr:VOC family protein [Nocardia sp. GTS18]